MRNLSITSLSVTLVKANGGVGWVRGMGYGVEGVVLLFFGIGFQESQAMERQEWLKVKKKREEKKRL